ncbi:MAG: DUF2785 domain-containing protein [Defluviitaleaceae bacterium]|nr:DUF2785 domain-containing protein [Defluviitaleaceae bacterium]
MTNLKKQLTQIKESNFKVPADVDLDELIAEMLKNIGDTDSELRDGLIYEAFCGWADETLSETQIRHILYTCLGEHHLFHSIGESETDSVFTRSFSALGVSVCLYTQYEKPFLSNKELADIKGTLLRYISLERDFRGYVEGKGWAHAIAHIADVFAHIVCFDNIEGDKTIGRDAMLEILDAVKRMVCNRESVYDTNEDERLAVVFVDACDSEVLSDEELTGWLDGFNMADDKWRNQSIPSSYYQFVNCKNFLRSVYFKLLANGGHEGICRHMLSFLVKE